MVASFRLPVDIGDDVTIGHNATIHGCRIGKGSLIGLGATVLNGAIIGERCLIGANSLVREGMVVPDGSLVIGVPAQIVRTFDEDTADTLSSGAARYRDKAKAYRFELHGNRLTAGAREGGRIGPQRWNYSGWRPMRDPERGRGRRIR